MRNYLSWNFRYLFLVITRGLALFLWVTIDVTAIFSFAFLSGLHPFEGLSLLTLFFFNFLVLLHLDNWFLLGLQDLHPFVECLEVEMLDLFLPLLLLKIVVLIDVADKSWYYRLCAHIVAEETARTDLLAAGGTLLLYLPIVVLDALTAKLVQTLPHIQWVLIHVRAHGTQQRCLLNLLKQVQVNIIIFIFLWGEKDSWLAGHLVVIKILITVVDDILTIAPVESRKTLGVFTCDCLYLKPIFFHHFIIY